MFIQSSNINMSSKYSMSKKIYFKRMQIDEAKVNKSNQSLVKKNKKKEVNADKNQYRFDDGSKNASAFYTKSDTVQETATQEEPVKSKEELEYLVVRRILELLSGVKQDRLRPVDLGNMIESDMNTSSISIKEDISSEITVPRAPMVWTRMTMDSCFFEETENTTYCSTGIVKTTDGREFDMNIHVEMSRSFISNTTKIEKFDYILCDPLVINVDASFASVEDQKFLFDLNSDGTEESISVLSKGSGFLALDQNDDGIINDGNELFGTKSGDGFADLAKYDSDQNGWIDEADPVFSKLNVWMKNEDGKDLLMSLKDSGVGAIYLGNEQTQFSLNSSENETNAMIRSTGIYLKESGEVGTIQHIDYVI